MESDLHELRTATNLEASREKILKDELSNSQANNRAVYEFKRVLLKGKPSSMKILHVKVRLISLHAKHHG